MLCMQHSGTAAKLQESRAEAGVVAALRTEAQKMALWDSCAGWLCRQRGLEDGCVGQLCREAQRTAVRTEGPRGRDQLATYRLALSEWDFSD